LKSSQNYFEIISIYKYLLKYLSFSDIHKYLIFQVIPCIFWGKTSYFYEGESNVIIKTMIRLVIQSFILSALLVQNIYAMPDVSKALHEVSFVTPTEKSVKLDRYEGKVMLVFFGYTHCPDICPTTMLDIRKSLIELGDLAERVQPVFISVDHQRDTPEIVSKYVDFFDKRILGLTSSKKMIDKITKYFKIPYELVDSKNNPNYIVEHSSNLYVIDENMVVKRIIPNGLPYTEITKTIRSLSVNN